jgi:CII-binding regulator of phage lambda lysogenization HflD
MGIPSKLIWLALLAIAGTSYVIYRKIIAAVDKSSVDSLINTLKKNSAKAKDVAETLDIPYGKRENFSNQDFDKLQSALQATSKIGDYTILYQTHIDVSEYLLITEITYADFDIGVTGNPTDVKKSAYHFFVLRFESNNNALSVLSDLYSDTTSKFQKEAFTKGLTAVVTDTK